ncbi:hypothetical protein [uncultured Tistrella sp.]|uniref:hypothetical protein n=1 Tax=Tistrella mobilis TaxID=171437 RepID=UPI000C08F2B7|nr:hypothetical protein [uncultured Tistrella sp.]MAM72665.1 hypothetical protein [Tistrella sp.]
MMMMQTTIETMMAAWRQTGGALPPTPAATAGALADDTLAAGPYFTATNGRGCIDADASISAAAVTFRVPGCVAEDCIDVDASISVAAMTFHVPFCITGDEGVSAAAVSWHGGICSTPGLA